MNPIEEFLFDIDNLPSYRDAIVHRHTIPSSPARYGDLDRPLSGAVARRLSELGINRLYTHQALAVRLLRERRNVVIATATASGKSLCYQIPTLEALFDDPKARACYIFPTKALAQDQLRSFRRALGNDSDIEIQTFDGDTPRGTRGDVKRNARVVITNPDTLHVSTLPWHRGWARFFRDLRYVVIDESHIYRGIFGSHVAMIIRRLRRLCALYGSNPAFALCSATIANPKSHAENLVGLPFELVDDDGSPRGEKEFIFWRTQGPDGERRLSLTEDTADVTADLMERGVRVMTFARSRNAMESVFQQSRNLLAQQSEDLSRRLRPYRAGYTVEQRRAIESDLRDGRISGIATTSAMELGVDIGHLDATVLSGYPGAVASIWQRAGRAGRRGRKSINVFVGSDHPVDQYFFKNPRRLFSVPEERALVSLDNERILRPHILAAAAEAPLSGADLPIFGERRMKRVAAALVTEGKMVFDPGNRTRKLAPGLENPSYHTSIRSATGEVCVIEDKNTGRKIERVPVDVAFREIYPGAVYINMGRARLIESVDEDAGRAVALNFAPRYETTADITAAVSVAEETKARDIWDGRARLGYGEIEVTFERTGYAMRKFGSGETIAEKKLNPVSSRTLRTTGLWLDIRGGDAALTPAPREPEALHAIEHAGMTALAFLTMSDPLDIRGIVSSEGGAGVFLYDNHSGGTGIAELGYERAERLWTMALEMMEGCDCVRGCPRCVETYNCNERDISPNSQRGAILLKSLIQGTALVPKGLTPANLL